MIGDVLLVLGLLVFVVGVYLLIGPAVGLMLLGAVLVFLGLAVL